MDEIQNPKSLINRDYEQIPLVSFDEWIESPERHSRLGFGITIEPKVDIYLIALNTFCINFFPCSFLFS